MRYHTRKVNETTWSGLEDPAISQGPPEDNDEECEYDCREDEADARSRLREE